MNSSKISGRSVTLAICASLSDIVAVRFQSLLQIRFQDFPYQNHCGLRRSRVESSFFMSPTLSIGGCGLLIPCSSISKFSSVNVDL